MYMEIFHESKNKMGTNIVLHLIFEIKIYLFPIMF